MGAILWFCAAFSAAQFARLSSIRMLLLSQSNETLALSVILRSVCALACFFALLKTGSRGGLICSCVALLVAATLLLANKWKLRLWHTTILALPAFALTLALLSQMGRIASQGLMDDGRWSVYELCLQAIKQRPLMGSGLGTFPDIFPSFRSSELASWGVWDFAHSTGLEIAVEMGAPMAGIVVLGAFASVFILLHAAVTCEAPDRQILAAIAGIAVLGYLHSLIDFSLQIPGFFIVFAILLGCGLARASGSWELANPRAPS
jgi:O-antigen ligase